MNLTLTRFCYSSMGTFGLLQWENGGCYVIERPWEHNASSCSCIPIGTYRVQRGQFPKHGECFEVQGVPGRSAILFHVANTIDDIEGCIGPGERLGCLNSKWAVFDSGKAYKRFMDAHVGQDVLTLRVLNDDTQGVL